MINLPVESNQAQAPIKRGRGRPPGSKNKPKQQNGTTENGAVFALPAEPKKRGRPPGSKNKPKLVGASIIVPQGPEGNMGPCAGPVSVQVQIPMKQESPHPTVRTQSEDQDSVDTHPIIEAAKWLEKKMPIIEQQYYKTRAAKTNTPFTQTVALAILGLFNVQDTEIRKQIKSI